MLVAVMVPTLALSALGGYGAVQRYADAEAVSGVTTQAGRVARTLRLYAGLVAEKSDSESFAVAAEQGLSPAVVSQLLGTDLEAELRSARTRVDAALAEGASATLTKNAPQLAALRARIDAGRASEVSVTGILRRQHRGRGSRVARPGEDVDANGVQDAGLRGHPTVGCRPAGRSGLVPLWREARDCGGRPHRPGSTRLVHGSDRPRSGERPLPRGRPRGWPPISRGIRERLGRSWSSATPTSRRSNASSTRSSPGRGQR